MNNSNQSTEQWYYLSGEDTAGPIAEAELKRLLEADVLPKDTYVFREGLETWVHACLLPEFGPVQSVNAQPVPSSPPLSAPEAHRSTSWLFHLKQSSARFKFLAGLLVITLLVVGSTFFARSPEVTSEDRPNSTKDRPNPTIQAYEALVNAPLLDPATLLDTEGKSALIEAFRTAEVIEKNAEVIVQIRNRVAGWRAAATPQVDVKVRQLIDETWDVASSMINYLQEENRTLVKLEQMARDLRRGAYTLQDYAIILEMSKRDDLRRQDALRAKAARLAQSHEDVRDYLKSHFGY